MHFHLDHTHPPLNKTTADKMGMGVVGDDNNINNTGFNLHGFARKLCIGKARACRGPLHGWHYRIVIKALLVRNRGISRWLKTSHTLCRQLRGIEPATYRSLNGILLLPIRPEANIFLNLIWGRMDIYNYIRDRYKAQWLDDGWRGFSEIEDEAKGVTRSCTAQSMLRRLTDQYNNNDTKTVFSKKDHAESTCTRFPAAVVFQRFSSRHASDFAVINMS